MLVPEPTLSTDSHRATKGIRDIDSVLTADTDAYTQTEGIRRLAQSPVLVAGGEYSHYDTPSKAAIENTIKSLADRGSLCKGQRGDPPLFSKVGSNLRGEEIEKDDQNQRVHEEYLLDDSELRYEPLG